MGRFDTLGLVFEDPVAGGGKIPSPPMARIYLKTFMTGPAPGFREPIQTLTPFEYGPDLFDQHADRLIDNINRLKREARRRFRKAKSK